MKITFTDRHYTDFGRLLSVLRAVCLLAAFGWPRSGFAQNVPLSGDEPVTQLINLQFGGDQTTVKKGKAAFGLSTNDFWNLYSRDGTNGYKSVGALSSLVAADGTPTGVSMVISNAPGAWGNGAADPMYGTYLYPLGGAGSPITVTLNGLQPGAYDLYLYGHGGPGLDNANSVFEAVSGGVTNGPAATTTGPGWTNVTWVEGDQFVVLRGVRVAPGQPLTVFVEAGAYRNSFLSGIQVVRSSGLPAPQSIRLINLQFGGNQTTVKKGNAAFGLSTNDFWNRYSRDGTNGYKSVGALSSLTAADGTPSCVNMVISNAPGAWGNGAPDPMYGTYLYPLAGAGSPITVTLYGLRPGTYDLYLYGHGGPGLDDANSVFEAVSGGVTNGPAATTTGPGWTNVTWIEGYQYVVLRGVSVAPGDPLTILVEAGAYHNSFLSGAQIVEVGAPYTVTVTNLIDVQFGAAQTLVKRGAAAFGLSTNDVWNFYSRDTTNGYKVVGSLDSLVTSDGSRTTASLVISNAPGAWSNGQSDNMYGTYLYPLLYPLGPPASPITVTLSGLAPATYDLYLYGHGGPGLNDANSVFESISGGITNGPLATTTGPGWTNVDWIEGDQYIVLRGVHVAVGDPLTVLVKAGAYGNAFLSGLQLVSYSFATNSSPLKYLLTIQPPGVSYLDSLAVSITGTGLPPGIEIHYTIDNTAPTPTSPVYTNTVTLTGAVIVRALAFNDGKAVSAEASHTYLQANGSWHGVGIPWLKAYFGTNFINQPSAAPDADPDGDGSTNLQEFLAGTNPLDPLSGFKTSLRLIPSVIWYSVIGQHYTVSWQSSLRDPWTPLTNILATAPISQFFDLTSTNAAGLYRVTPSGP